jgi:hypothetical protein
MLRFLFILILFPIAISANDSYTTDDFLYDWSIPIREEKVRNIVYIGSATTLVLVLTREQFVDPLQEDIAEAKPLGRLAPFGDLMGQLVPNILYVGGMYWHHKSTGDENSYDRVKLMVKTTFYSGLTTTVLKHTIRQPRPHGHNRASFPSGHTSTAFSFASVVGMEHEWYYGAAAYTLAGIVAMSRMNDNEHYLHDVVFGATIGISYGMSFYYQKEQRQDSAGMWQVLPIDTEGGAMLNYVALF